MLKSRQQRYKFARTLLQAVANCEQNGVSRLEILHEITVEEKGLLGNMAKACLHQLQEGRSFLIGFEKWLDEVDLQLLVNMQETEGLAKTVEYLTRIIDSRASILKYVVSALSYPLFLLVTSIALLMGYLRTEVLPDLNSLSQQLNIAKPFALEVLNDTVLVLSTYYKHTLFFIALLIVGLRLVFASVGGVRNIMDRIKPFSLHRRFTMLRLYFQLAVLVENGYSWASSVQKLLNRNIKKYDFYLLKLLEDRLNQGHSVAFCLSSLGMFRYLEKLEVGKIAPNLITKYLKTLYDGLGREKEQVFAKVIKSCSAVLWVIATCLISSILFGVASIGRLEVN